MIIRLNVQFENDKLDKVLRFATESTREYWLKLLGQNKNMQNLEQRTKYTVLITLAAVGLLKNGFDEKETMQILENLFEIDTKYLSPGNKQVH